MGLSCGLFIQGITTDSRKRKSTHPSTKALAIAALCSTLEASNVCVFRIPSDFEGLAASSCSWEFQAPCKKTRSLLSFQSRTSRGLKLEASDWKRLEIDKMSVNRKIYSLISVKIVKACSGAEVLQWKLLLNCIKRFLRFIF